MNQLLDGPPGPPGTTPEAKPKAPKAPQAPKAIQAQVPPDFIPGVLPAAQVHLLSGAPGAGKTAIVSQLAASLMLGTEFFSLPIACRPAFLGVIVSDRAWRDHHQWFTTAGLPDLPHYSLVDDPHLSGAKLDRTARKRERFALFEASVSALCSASSLPALPWNSFLIVDPISLFLGGDFNNYDRAFTHLFDLNQFAQRLGCTILAVAHAGKQKGDSTQRYSRPQDRVAGTTAQTGCTGTTFHLSPPTESGEEWHELVWAPHHAPAGGRRIAQSGPGGLFLEVNDTTPTRKETQAVVKAQRLLPVFPQDGAEIHSKELVLRAAALNIPRRSALRYLAQLEADKIVASGPSGRGYWRLTNVLPA